MELEKEHNFFAFHQLGQSPMLGWAHSLSVEPVNMLRLKQINLQLRISKDTSRCEVIHRSGCAFCPLGKLQLQLNTTEVICGPGSYTV